MIMFLFFPAHFFHHLLSKPFLPCSPCPEQAHPLQQPVLPITFSSSLETCPDPPLPGEPPGRAAARVHAAEVCSQPRGRMVLTPAPRGVPAPPLPLPRQGPAIPWPARDEPGCPWIPQLPRWLWP